MTIKEKVYYEQFNPQPAEYYKGSHVIILVCCLDDEYSLIRLIDWYREAEYYKCVKDPNVIHVYALAATKSDLPATRREVTRETLLEYAQQYNI